MFYGNDDDGHIIFGDSLDVLPPEYQETFSDFQIEDFESFISDQQPVGTVSGNDVIIENHYDVSYTEPIDYDYLYDLLANIPQYNVYPNATAVNIFTQVLNGLDGRYFYVISAGSTTSDTYLYYSKDYSVSGNTITLSAPVTVCRYYYYTASSQTQYTYSVSTVNDVETISLSNKLVYTNCMDGYPDVIPYKSKEVFSVSVSLVLLFGALLVASLSKFWRKK